jgi:hypothetical protein
MLIALVLNVTDERRPAYEDFMSTQDVRNKRILEPSFFKAPAANRSSYLPVPYLLFSPVLDPLYSDRIPNMDVLPIPCVLGRFAEPRLRLSPEIGSVIPGAGVLGTVCC